MNFSSPDLHVFGGTIAKAKFRLRNEDFRVDEVLRFEPEGAGTHVWLRIEKSGRNTIDVVRTLARYADVGERDIGYAGQKDRYAVATQWFSVNFGQRADPEWYALEGDGLKLLAVTRHGKKLRKGQLRGNRFCITLREVEADRATLETRLEQISRFGVPNYFGPQRFGRGGANLQACAAMFSSGKRIGNRYRRGMLLSAARAWLFNRVLSRRVGENSWNQVLKGDILMFDDSRSRFVADAKIAVDDPRFRRLELHPTGPLWGNGSPETCSEAAALERGVAREYALFSDGLKAAGLEADRRALRLAVKSLSYRFEQGDVVRIDFFLRAGAFATSVLREIVSAPVPSSRGVESDTT